MSIDDVAAATNIRPALLQRIEGDDFSHCGGDVYARGHLRAICRAIGIDAAPVLDAFAGVAGGTATADADADPAPAPGGLDPALGDLTTPPAPVRTGSGAPVDSLAPLGAFAAGVDGDARPRRRGIPWTLVLGIALAAVLVVAGVRLFTGQDGSGSTATGDRVEEPAGAPGAPATPTTTPSSAPTRPAPTPTAGPTVGPTLTPTAVATGAGVRVVVRVDGDPSWIQARGSDGLLFQGVIAPGQVRRFADDQQVRLVLGNAGAVRLEVNGEDLGTAGRPGQVVRVAYGPGRPARG